MPSKAILWYWWRAGWSGFKHLPEALRQQYRADVVVEQVDLPADKCQCLLGDQPLLAGSRLGRGQFGALETSHESLTGYTFPFASLRLSIWPSGGQ